MPRRTCAASERCTSSLAESLARDSDMARRFCLVLQHGEHALMTAAAGRGRRQAVIGTMGVDPCPLLHRGALDFAHPVLVSFVTGGMQRRRERVVRHLKAR